MGMNKSILIIDDDDLIVEALSQRLKKEQFDFISVNNAFKALELVMAKTKIDLIVMDLMLPKLSGLKLLKILNIHYPSKVPVIFISSLNNTEIILSAMEKGAKDFFSKPLNFDDLIARIKFLV